jgi:antitoxin (DNA-binding transcriptional repressor) of toxin-antitoxin stability system
MKKVSFTQLRNNAKRYFDDVEDGETLEIYRHGKALAILSPAPSSSENTRWKKVKPRTLAGVSLSKAILDERHS